MVNRVHRPSIGRPISPPNGLAIITTGIEMPCRTTPYANRRHFQPTLIRWPSIPIIPPPRIARFSRNDFSRLMLRMEIGRRPSCAAAHKARMLFC
jgi:hypothetical protein